MFTMQKEGQDNKVILKEHASWVDAYSDVVTRSYNFTEYDPIIFRTMKVFR